ncbi:hypothetical protein [Haloglomus litoreum]|nr:hypothetical protein [Haloglomus sp. DT116]
MLVDLPEGPDQGTLVTAEPDALTEVSELLQGMHYHLSTAVEGAAEQE